MTASQDELATRARRGARRRRRPPPACKDLLGDDLRRGARELGKPRSGTREAGRGRARRRRRAPARRRARRRRRCAPTPTRCRERAWLLVAAVVGALVELAAPAALTGAEDSSCAPASRPAALVLGLPGARLDAGRARGARRRSPSRTTRTASTACAPARSRCPRGVLERRRRCASRSAPRHPLRVAEAVARLGGRPADPRSVEDHEEAVLALLGAATAAPRARTRTPTRPAASPAGSSSASTAWASGAATTPTSPTWRAASPATTARWPRRWGRRCSTPACWPRSRRSASATSSSTRAAPAEIRRLIDDGELPGGHATAVSVKACAVCDLDLGSHDRRLTTKLHHARRRSREAGILRPSARTASSRTARALLRFGTDARRPATRPRPRAIPTSAAIIDELGHADVPRGPRAHQRARPRARPTTASARATASRSCAATTAASSTPSSPCSKLGANALFLNTAFSGPQLADVAKREKPKAIIYDQEFAEVLARRRRAGASATSPGTSPRTASRATRRSRT